ncbi:LuxR C-terminal-related transcriptional regulator [Gordonia effusa]|uniref:LuxR C-terminal-related transcriptional regulator n=1 Tax=Gordonia effusa TaxID=263908 RepID=UPI001FE11DF2|nr:LuxR C-terminal-related transcriptional regulator [Gordonia effusa]
MTVTAADAHMCEESIRRNRDALERLASRRTIAPGPVQTVWPVDISRHRLGVVGGGQVIRRFVHSSISDDAVSRGLGPDDLLRPALSPREIEVLRAWLVLDSKLAVAESLFIAMGTVNTHLTRIRTKYADVGRPAPTKASLVARAVQDGIIALEDL